MINIRRKRALFYKSEIIIIITFLLEIWEAIAIPENEQSSKRLELFFCDSVFDIFAEFMSVWMTFLLWSLIWILKKYF